MVSDGKPFIIIAAYFNVTNFYNLCLLFVRKKIFKIAFLLLK